MALPVNGSTHLIPAYYSVYRPRKDSRLSWPSWLTCSGWLTHISGHPSATGRAQDRESSPSRDRRSTTVPRHQLRSTCKPNLKRLASSTPKIWPGPQNVEMVTVTLTTPLSGMTFVGRLGLSTINLCTFTFTKVGVSNYTHLLRRYDKRCRM